ncbi:hypothetical protein MJO28_002491 [Puccinia striiformis f. sp. tritici]|uniref:Uncharacterized protein n=1 Tax=Puccinia striiformis f. sp. tritici TaxID=168172 RepID=A0ACC0ETH3_9BASI|nr:hypothetical protein MJO29_016551 [Puccinia striiformis f. sp. tritici]KAI7958700.1 hypothetical protein MJO28_002491 [Puccinia striiformis f. sp. tritici]
MASLSSLEWPLTSTYSAREAAAQPDFTAVQVSRAGSPDVSASPHKPDAPCGSTAEDASATTTTTTTTSQLAAAPSQTIDSAAREAAAQPDFTAVQVSHAGSPDVSASPHKPDAPCGSTAEDTSAITTTPQVAAPLSCAGSPNVSALPPKPDAPSGSAIEDASITAITETAQSDPTAKVAGHPSDSPVIESHLPALESDLPALESDSAVHVSDLHLIKSDPSVLELNAPNSVCVTDNNHDKPCVALTIVPKYRFQIHGRCLPNGKYNPLK